MSIYRCLLIRSAAQVRYMKDNKFGGAFVWALDLDDFANQFCAEGNHPLLGHLRNLLDIGKSDVSVKEQT